jgi:membrane associated rhomboid family serine protease
MDFNVGYSNTTPLITHFTYNFSHVNIWHLVLNSLAYIGVFRMLEKSIKHWKIILLSLSVAIIASFFASYDIPTMGASGMIYAMIGMWFGLVMNKTLTIIDKKLFLIYCLSVILMLAVSFFKHNSNFLLHSYCLGLGVLTQIKTSHCKVK